MGQMANAASKSERISPNVGDVWSYVFSEFVNVVFKDFYRMNHLKKYNQCQ